MKKAIALGVLLGASFISFAFAQSSSRQVTVVAGQPISFAYNGEQIILKNMNKDVASIEFNFLPEHLSGTIQIVEYPPYTSDHDVWISKTPGGEPVPGFEKQRLQYFGAPIDFYHPSLKALGGRYATFKYLEHGKYYYNTLPVYQPAYSAVAHTLRTASMSHPDEVKVFSPSITLGATTNTTTVDVENILDFGSTAYKRFNPNASAGKTTAYAFNFVGYEMGKISMVEDVNSVAGDNGSYTVWLSKTPGGAPITVKNAGGTPFTFEKRSWGWHGGTLTIASANNPYGGTVLTPGEYYFNVTSALKTSYWVQVNMTKDVLNIENALPVSKRWDDLITTLTTRVTVDLSGTQVGAVAFGSWRYYAGTPADLDQISVSMTPSFTYPVGMVDLVVSPVEGSFTPISPECSLQTEQTLALKRNATMMRFTTKKFEELTEAQKRLGYCILQPDTKYYMNVRFVDKNGVTTCTKDRCGIYIDVNYSGAVSSSANSCSLLSKNLATGSKDALTSGEVTKLQTFLQGTHLSVAPTGYYGNMTSAAVKSFQRAYGISQLGIVGPQTKAKINELYCSGTTLTPPPVAQSVIVTTPTPSYQGGSGVNVSSPFAGQFVKNESTKTAITTITWEQTTGAKTDIVTIDLYDAGGSYVKTIAQNTSNSGSYVWRYDPTLENGTYKIVVKVGSLSGESGVFTIGMASFVATNPITNPVVTTSSASDDYDILGRVIPTPTGPAGASMCEGMGGTPSPGSGSGPCGSYEIPVGNCSSGMTGENAITRAWQYNLENSLYLRKGNSIRFSLKRDNAMVFRFKTGASGEYTLPSPIQFAYDEHTANGPAYTRFTSLSEQKCDFNYNKLYIPNTPLTETVNNCFQSETYTGALLGMVTATGNDIVPGNITKNFPKCQLKPNTYYYLNIRWEKAVTSSSRGQISCPVGNNAQNVCGTVIGAN